MKNIKLWPHLTIIAIVIAVLAGIGVSLWMKHEGRATAEELPNAARIQRVEGDVAIQNGLESEGETAEWAVAEANQPFSVGDRIYTRENSHASLAFTGRNFARLDPNTSLDVLTLTDDRTQLALRNGFAIFDVGDLPGEGLFEVATPFGAVNFNEPGLYSVGLDEAGALVSVLNGLAQVVGLGGSGEISKGEVLRLVGQTATDVVLSRLDGGDAGYLVDDYYSYQYPNYYDGRYRDYNAYLEDPYYFDPFRRNVSYQYVTALIPGVNDLDYYGDWSNIDGHGFAWRPRVDTGWAPYQQGYWINDFPYGPTWVSTEPWGYAPYHYGRWAHVGNEWYWIPEAVNTTPRYSPALVAFVPLDDANAIGWVPLGPGDPYVMRYYDAGWQPHYLTRVDVVQPGVVNLAVPGAVTVIPIDQFGRVIDPRIIRRVDPQVLTSVRPVLDPLTLTPLRNAVLHSAWGRGKIDLPPGIAKKLYETSVVTTTAPIAPPFRRDLPRAMRVESVPERVKKERFAVRDERREAGRPDTTPTAAAEREVRGGRRQTGQEERGRRAAERSPQAQGERVASPAQQRPQAGRHQPPAQPRGEAKGKEGPPAGAEKGQGRGKGKGGKP